MAISSFSRAKIKTVKLTVAVIGLYLSCSAPFICVQLWSTYGTVPDSVSKLCVVWSGILMPKVYKIMSSGSEYVIHSVARCITKLDRFSIAPAFLYIED